MEKECFKKKRTFSYLTYKIKNFIKLLNSTFSVKEPEQKTGKKYLPIIICMFVFIILFSIFIKYPSQWVGFELGDSLAYHGFARQIQNTGLIPWIHNPLSYYGLYPASQASGMLVIMAGMSEIYGADMIYTVWPLLLVQIIAGTFGSFIMFYEFKKDIRFAIPGTMLFTLTTRFMIHTSELSFFYTRGFFLTFLPFFMWSVFRYINHRNNKSMTVMIIFALIIPTIHQMGFFIPILVVGYLIAYYLKSQISPTFSHTEERRKILQGAIVGSTLFLLFIGYYFAMTPQLLARAQGVIRFNPEDIVGTSVDIFRYMGLLVYSYGKFIGAMSPIFLIGFPLFLFKPVKNLKEYVVLITLLLFLPILGAYGYVGVIIIPLMLIPISYALYLFLSKEQRKIPKRFTIVLVVLAIVIGSTVYFAAVDHSVRHGRGVYRFEDAEYRFAEDWYSGPVYFRYNSDGYRQIARTRVYGVRVRSIDGYGTGESAYADRFPYENVYLRPFRSLLSRPERPFAVRDLYESGFPVSPNEMWSEHVDENETKEYFRRADIRYITLSRLHVRWAKYEAGRYYEENPTVVYSTVHTRYMIYQGNYNSFFYI